MKFIELGGYLQWLEMDMLSWQIRTTSPENKTEALANLMKISLSKDDRFKASWIAKLPDIFRENECDAKDPPPEMTMPLHEASMLVYENLTRQAKDSEWSKAIKEGLPEALSEAAAGAGNSFTWYMVVGQKPLA
ncbi:hypothetical protein N7494_010934 [Penicillium frequentans]|uniref:Uncharacterized protein n=1 Tax=Penicillium frequentans TaxID=3151616 RepID=A0AAD6GA80_9EURO|nr:hypothetical protein N7494_010934 [Penicillium glabrum]